jgi:hypothetical protein
MGNKPINVTAEELELLQSEVASETKTRHTFCKENDIKIDLFSDEYFWDRIDLFGVTGKYIEFIKLLRERFNLSVGEYLGYRDKISAEIIEYLKNTSAYQDLNNCNMNDFFVEYQDYVNVPRGDIYKQCNIGREYISVDIKRANYVALVHYSNQKGYDTFDEFGYNFNKFIGQFTDIEYIKNNKRLREIIFGNINGKRIATYEKYIIMQLLSELKPKINNLDTILSKINNDEFIIDITDINSLDLSNILSSIEGIKEHSVPISVIQYKLKSIKSLGVFIKEICNQSSTASEIKYELACANKYTSVLATKAINNIPIQKTDLTFMSELGPAVYLKVPDLTII